MKKKKTAAAALSALALMTALSGCGSKFKPDTSSIYVKKDGTVVSADIESFEGSNYSEEELTTYVEDAVKLYNSEHGAESAAYEEKDMELPVEVDSLKVEDGTATLYLNYETCSDYMEFTGTAGMENGILSTCRQHLGSKAEDSAECGGCRKDVRRGPAERLRRSRRTEDCQCERNG